MSYLEVATLRNTAKGRIANKVKRSATEEERVRAELIFGRTALSFADVEFLVPILARAEVQ